MTLASMPLSLVKVNRSTLFPSAALPKGVGPSMAAKADHELARTQTTSAKLFRRERFMDRSKEKVMSKVYWEGDKASGQRERGARFIEAHLIAIINVPVPIARSD